MMNKLIHFLFIFCMVLGAASVPPVTADDFQSMAQQGQAFGRSAGSAFNVNTVKTNDDGTIALPEMVCVRRDAAGNCTQTAFQESTPQVICVEPAGETDMTKCTRTSTVASNTTVHANDLFPGTGQNADTSAYFADSNGIDDLNNIKTVDQYTNEGKKSKEALYADATKEKPATMQGQVYGLMMGMMDKPRLDVKNDPALETSRKIFENEEQLQNLVGDCKQITEYVESETEYTVPDYKICTRPVDKSAQCKINHEINSHNESASVPIQIRVPVWDNVDHRNCQVELRNPANGKTYLLPVIGRSNSIVSADSWYPDCGLDYNADITNGQTDESKQMLDGLRSIGYIPWRQGASVASPIDFNLAVCRSGTRGMIAECRNQWQARTINVINTVVDAELWSPDSCIESAKGLYDKFATGSLTCGVHYSRDPSNPDCAFISTTNNTEQGYICKDKLGQPPYPDLDPFCAQYDLKADYTWYKGDAPCYTDIFGNQVCPKGGTGTARSTCEQYETNPSCKLHKENGCVDGAQSADGTCYESEEIWDCGDTKKATDYFPVTRVECTGASSCGMYQPGTQLAKQNLRTCTKEVKQQQACTAHHKLTVIATNHSVPMKIDGRVSYGWFGAPDRWTIDIKNPATNQMVSIAVYYSNRDPNLHPLGATKATFSVSNLALTVNYLIASQGKLPAPFNKDWIPDLANIGFPIDRRSLVRQDGSTIYDPNFPINFRFDQSLWSAIFGSGVNRTFEYQTTSVAESFEPQECLDTYNEGLRMEASNVATVSTQCVAEFPVNEEGCIFVDQQAVCDHALQPPPFRDIGPTCERINVSIEFDNKSDQLDGCRSLEASKSCGFISSTCIERNPLNQQCTKYEKTYDCGGTEAVAPSTFGVATEPQSCQIRCMGEECVQPERTQSNSFNQAVASMNAAQYAVQDMDCSKGKDNCRVFAGQGLGCTFMPEVVGIQAVNCCEMPSTGTSMQKFIAAGQALAQIDKAIMGMESANSMVTGYQNIHNVVSGQSTATMDAVTAPFNGVKSSIDAGMNAAEAWLDEQLKKIKQKIADQLGTTVEEGAVEGGAEAGTGAVVEKKTEEEVRKEAERNLMQEQVKGAINTIATVYMYYQMTMLALQLAFPCEEEAYALQAKKDMDLCHPIGTYCEKTTEAVTGISTCVLKKTNYCCYNSILGKIINEQGLGQLGRNFGTKREPVCDGFQIQEISKLNFEAMDLGEWIATLQENELMPTPASMTLEKLTGSDHFLSELDPDAPREDITTRADRRLRDDQGNPLPFSDLRKDAAESTFLDPR